MREDLSFVDFVDRFIRVENPVTGRLDPMVLYPQQRVWAQATFEDRDARGLRRYRRSVFSHVKKSGKTALGPASALYMLLFDPFEKSREVYSIAWDLDQARLVFRAAVSMVKRSPELLRLLEAGILRFSRDALELDWGEATGEFRCLASDTKGSHGKSPSCLIVDETWNQPTYDLLEACSLPPTRRCPLELHFTYAGLTAQQVEGVPLWDLWQAGTQGTDPKLFFLARTGRAVNADVPWITDEYLRERETALPTNRFKRLHLNEWGSADATFLTEWEIGRALDGSVAYVAADRTHRWVAAIDYGRTFDHTAIAVSRKDEQGRVITGELIVLKGTQEHPVNRTGFLGGPIP